MTKDEAIKLIVDLAKSQVGTKEGANNWNPYAADPLMTQAYGMNMQNQPWCAVFVNWLFIHQFGLPLGKEMTYGCSAGCYNQADMYKAGNAFGSVPHLGDQAFYTTGAGHTGLVVNITNEYFDAVEGNYSDKVSLVRHRINGSDLYGFGTPNWSLVAEVPEESEGTGLLVDGQCGENTWAALLERLPKDMPLVKYGSKGWAVAMCQSILDYLGADLDTDGDCGRLTENAIKDFQRGAL